jgi:hypothetical protein
MLRNELFSVSSSTVSQLTAPNPDIGCNTCMVDVDQQRTSSKETSMSSLLRRSVLLPVMAIVIVLAIVMFFA